MGSQRKYDDETKERAVRFYEERRRDHPSESALQARKRVGELLDVKQDTLRGWVERAEIDAGTRPGNSSEDNAEIVRLKKEVAELKRANEMAENGVGFFRGGGARPQTFLIVAYIDAFKDRFGVEPICRVLTEHDIKIAPSTYYAHTARQRVSQADWDDAHMANRLVDLWRANRSLYGVDKLHAAARRAGIDIGRDQVARLMRMAGIAGVTRGEHQNRDHQRRPGRRPSPRPVANASGTHRCGPTSGGWPISPTRGPWSGSSTSASSPTCSPRRILGWRVTSTKTTPLVLSALEQALFCRRRTSVAFTATGMVFHSDAA